MTYTTIDATHAGTARGARPMPSLLAVNIRMLLYRDYGWLSNQW